MGHDIIRCDFICNHSTKFKWEKPNKNTIKEQSYIINSIELKPNLIL